MNHAAESTEWNLKGNIRLGIISKLNVFFSLILKKYHKFKNKRQRAEVVDNKLFKSRQWLSGSRAESYADQLKKTQYDNLLLNLYCNEISTYCAPGSFIFDAGAGTGALSLALSQKGFFITAFDISDEMLFYIKQQNPKIEVRCGDLFGQYDIHEQYDAVVSRWVVPHFAEWRSLIKSWSKIIKPGGFIIFDMPNREHIEFFDEKSKSELSNFIGYNHAKSSDETDFYACADEKELLELAQTTSLKLVSRRPHGIWKSNLKIASLMGGVAFKEFINRMNKAKDDDTNFDIIKKIEIAASLNLEVQDFHGSIVIFQKVI